MTARALSTPLLNWLRSSRTRRQLAKGLGGGDKPNDTYLRMATVALDFMASDALNQPHTDPTAAAPEPFDMPATRAGTFLFDLLAQQPMPDTDRRRMQALIPKAETEAAAPALPNPQRCDCKAHGSLYQQEHRFGCPMFDATDAALAAEPKHCCPPHTTIDCRDDCDGMCECC